MVKIKRVYDLPQKKDGIRILVDRLWPRGLQKNNDQIDLWLKEVGPSNELRKWFNHDPQKWAEFKQKYFKELEGNKHAIKQLLNHKGQPLTLLYAAKNEMFNNAVALKEYLILKNLI